MMSVQETYAAERAAASLLRRGGRVVLPSGLRVDLGPARAPVFNTLSQPLMRGMVGGLYAAFGGQGAPPELVVSRRMQRKATYSRATHRITLPAARWAWDDELVLLHECAHAATWEPVSGQLEAHGERWRRAYCGMVHRVLGPGVGLLMEDSLGLVRG